VSKWEHRIMFGLLASGVALALFLPAFGREYRVDAFWGQLIGLLGTTLIASEIVHRRHKDDDDDKEE
jgi:hypothetical protein